jgi:uncharacterized protein
VIEPAPETIEPPVVQPPAVLPIERAAALLEVILCSGFPTQIVVITLLAAGGLQAKTADGRFNAPFIFALTLLDTVLLVGLVVFFLRAHREPVSDALFGRRRLDREFLLGLALIPASFVVVILSLLVVQLVAPSWRNVPQNPFADLARNATDTVIFAFVVMVAGGVREEIQRGFILRRFDQYLGGGTVGLALFSLLFGIGHLEQGYDVALATAILGAFWGWIFLRRRSVAAPMVGHAGFNLLQVAKFVLWGA